MPQLTLVDQLREGRQICALWQQGASELMVEMSALAGFDTLVIDNEHGPAGIPETLRLVRCAHVAGARAVVRVPDHGRGTLSRTIDTGVAGLLVPMVNTAEEARRVVDICRYAPVGNRGLAPNSARASGYGANTAYVAQANDRLLLAVQIETAEAIRNLGAILAVPGIDMLFIGPGDLSATMGFSGRPDAPEVVAAINAARTMIQAAGRLTGTVPRPDIDTAGLFAEGYDLVVDGSDMALLRNALKAKRAAMPEGRQRR